MRRPIPLLALLLLPCWIPAQTAPVPSDPISDTLRKAAKLPNVAVNDLTPHGVSASDAAIVSEQLRAELVGTGKFRVMERGQMDQILKEQAFQQSGACDNSECAVEVGKLLAVDRMVSGSVGKIGELYTLQARLLDVQTGEVLFTANQSFEGRIEDLLARVVPKLAARLASGGAVQGKGDLFVTTNPVAAEIYVDGERKGTAPLNLQAIASGDHRIEARSGSLYAAQDVSLRPDDVQRLELRLEVAMGSLKVYSDPIGARASLDDGRDLGLTPLRVDRIPAGRHKVSLFLDSSHVPMTREVEIPAQGMGAVNAKLQPGAVVVIQANVPAQLRFVSGKDTVSVRPPTRLWFPSGTWQTEGDAGSDYRSLTQGFTVLPGKSTSYEFHFEHTQRWLDSTARAEHRATVLRWRWGSAIATVAAAGVATYFHVSASQASDDAGKALATYRNAGPGSDFEGLWSTYQSANDRNRTQSTRALIADVTAGILAAGCGLTFAF